VIKNLNGLHKSNGLCQRADALGTQSLLHLAAVVHHRHSLEVWTVGTVGNAV
jgi:hypothetical protein